MRKFGAYEVLHALETGGMGSVLLARKRGLGAYEQLVAIKTIRPEHASTPAVRAMFLDEAAILARLSHPAVATVHDFGEQDGTLYMALEYVAGLPFREVLEYDPPPTVIARMIIEACRGLHAAHELRDLAGQPLELVHRDISPDNLLLGFDGHVKVIDFGIALIKKNRQAPVTEFGMLKGKPPYMSPEQIANEAIARRSDVFSLAVVLWELLTRRPLFTGDSVYAIALAVTKQPIEPPSSAAGIQLPAALDAAVMRALERDVSRRTPTAAAFAEELETIAGDETLEAWSARELAAKRDEHRDWLASIVNGTPLPKAVGRATGQVTEVAPIGNAATVAPIAAVSPLVADATTSVGRDEDEGLSIPPRNRFAPFAVLLLALLLAAGVAYITLRPRTTVVTPPDARVVEVADATVVVIPPPVDAAVSPDALVPRDASVRIVTTRVDASVRSDAAVRPDAPPPALGSGTVTIKYKPGPYANISIDDGPALPGPIFRRKLAAGRHTIKFLDAKSGEVLDEQTVELADNEALTIRQRE